MSDLAVAPKDGINTSSSPRGGTSSSEQVIFSNSDAVWYLQTRTGLIGPLDLPSVGKFYESGVIDGLTYAWKNGMVEWKQIADLTELKETLISNEEGEEDDAENKISSKAVRKSIPVSETEGSTTCDTRLPLEEVPSEHKYITPEGIGQVYDFITKTWITFAQYQRLVNQCTEEQSSEDDSGSNSVNVEQETRSHQQGNPELNLLTKYQRNAESRRKYRERLKEKKKAGLWVKPKVNPNVYITGLPPDVTEEEVEEIFKRAGVLKIDPDTSKSKIRIYRHPNGLANGDALVTYASETSVELAIKYLNNTTIRNDWIIKVEQANFDLSGKPSPQVSTNAKDRQLERKRYLAAKLEQERLLGWNEGVGNPRLKTTAARVMVLRPLWTYNEALKYHSSHSFYTNIAQQLEKVLADWISVKRVTAIARHPKGIICVKFRSAEDCEAAVARLDGRDFHHMGLPERHAQMMLDLFEDLEKKNPNAALYLGNAGSPPSLDLAQIELLKNLDALTGEENRESQKKRRRLNSDDFEDALEGGTIEEHGSSSVDLAAIDSERMARKLRLADMIIQKPLLIEAYVYDGKTDLKEQVLLDENTHETKALNQLESEKADDSKALVMEHEEEDKSWTHWLEGEDSEDEEFQIITEDDA